MPVSLPRLRALLPGLVFLLGLLLAPSAALAQRQPEFLGRGIIALRGVDAGGNGTNNWTGSTASQVYVGWRLLATDPDTIGFNVYRSANGGAPVKLTSSPVTTSTNYIDTTATLTLANAYHVRLVVAGVEGAASEVWTLPANSAAQPCFTIPMPALPDGAHYVHLAWPGDLDGDGHTDIVVDRIPTAGGTLRVEGYSTAIRSRLWTIDLGPASAGLVSAGQNDGVTVFDFDGDGRCEVVTKTTAGTVFGDGAVLPGSGTAVYLSVVDGATGAERSRFQIATANAASTDAKNIGVAHLDGVRPALVVMDEAHDFSAFNVHPTTLALSLRWKLNSPGNPYPHGHGIRIGDLDGDGLDEVSDLAMAIDDDGTLLFQNELNHGDRYHIADIDPDRPGLECFAVQQDNPSQLNYVLYDALTGQMLWRKYAATQVDNGRGNIGSIDSRFTGQQSWSASGGVLVDHLGNAASNTQPGSCNFSLWWDADLLRETLNRQIVDKWNSSGTSGGTSRLLTGYDFQGATYSWRDAVPLYGDILGDWREEIVTDNGAGTQLVIFSTTRPATARHYTLLQDPQYRADLTVKGYMQSHHPGFYFGQNMPRAPRAPAWAGDLTWVGNASANTWDKSSARWKTTATGAATSTFTDGQSVLFDLTGVASVPVTLAENLAPSSVVVHAPKGQSYTFAGPGSLTGAMTLTKAGQGSLTLSGTHAYTGTTVVNEGTLLIDGQLSGSPVRVDSRGMLGGSGAIGSAVSVSELRAALAPGGLGAPGTLTLGGGLTLANQSVVHLDLAATPAAANDRVTVTGNLSNLGANVVYLQLNLLDGTLAPGATHTLFTYTGSFSGQLGAFTLRGAEAFPCTLANTGSAITLTVGTLRPAAAVTWAGSSSSWTLATGTAWLNNTASPTAFVTGDTATFDASGSASPNVLFSTSVLPAATVVNSTTDYTFGGTTSGRIAGSGGLTKSGSGTLTISTANTYTGPTVINGGIISVTSLADGGQPSPLGASSAAPANLVLNGGTLRLSSGSTSTFRGATLGTAGGTLDLPSASSVLNLGGPLTGSGSLTKTGPGLLILNAVNTHSGGTVLQAGTIVLTASREDNSPTSPIQYGLGSGPITLQGGTLSLSDTSQGDLDYVDSRAFWPIVVPAGATARLEANGRMQLGGALTGAGDLTFRTPYVRTDVTGNWSAFTGRLFVIADGDGGDFRIANSAGLAGAWLDLAANVWAYSRAGSGLTTMNIGSLSGSAGAVLDSWTGSGAGSHQPAHWRIGARGDDTTFAGVISGNSIVTKQGPGTLTLAGANTYTGATTVAAGKLVLASGGSLSGTAVTVQSNAGFGGAGAVTGNLTFNAGSTLLADPATGPLAITGNLTLGGSITVAPAPGATLAAGTYPLFTYTGTLTGSPAYAWSGPGYAASFDTAVPGTLSLTLTPTIDPPTNLVALPGDAQAALSWSASPTAATYTVRRAAVAGGPYADITSGLTTLAYTDPGLTNGRTYFYVVVAVASDGGLAASDQVSVSVGGSAPHARWRLDETSGATATDSSAQGQHGTLVNSPARTAGRIDQGLNLASASSQHVTVPSGVVSTLNDFTLSLWVRPTSLANWTRLVDLGTGTNNYLFITPQNGGTGVLRFAIRTAAVAEQVINGTSALPAATWSHVAVTLSGSTGTLYLNGVAVGSNPAMTLTPASLGVTTQNYFGRSQFPDPYFNGLIDEVAIHARALTPAEVAALAAPPAAPTGLSATAGVSQVTLAWSAVADVTGYAVHRALSAVGPFTTIATNLSGPSFTDPALPVGVAQHYVITALKTLAEGPRSPVASATPISLHQDWRLAHFGSTAATGAAADTADPDADGLVNLLEYALGGDPLSSSDAPLPVLSLTPSLPNSLRLTFTRIADPALTYAVEAATSLSTADWSVIWTSFGTANTPGPVTVPDPEPISAHPRRFLRLRVSH